MRFRTGIGVDIHAFTPDGTLGLVLAGVSFPDQRSLAGYSDGDVACHAAADAILSAAGLGDLGELVKPHGAQWEDATGVELLTHAAQVVAEAGFQIS
ncbi:MAG TPA: 2-C-methyl-D-erythritol 2,4-cyclodiphosphate synthase, partial [Beutenbergiaceae bacterium]|nr:2-C-methyl-D-erythritol 2,4-cyclodiphosphate synthase [Beutenbergiaceae bacterium]